MKRLLAYVMLMVIALSMLDISLCSENSLVRSIREVYSKLVEAEKKGADVREAALKLERALELVRAAEENPDKRDVLLSEARRLVDEVNSSIPSLIEKGEREAFLRNVVIASAISLVTVSAGITYYYGPRVFWGIWLKLRSRWIVEVLKEHEKEVKKGDRRRG